MTKSYLVQRLIIVVLLMLQFPHNAMSEAVNKLLPGSHRQLGDVCAKSDLIVVATIQDLGLTTPAAAGQVAYHATKLTVVQVLKGDATGTIIVSLKVRFEKGRIEETIPDVGKEYIFFIQTDNETHRRTVVKMLPSDTQTLTIVRNAIGADHS